MNDKKFDIVFIGELNIDLVLWNAPMPEYEQEKLAEDMRFAMGSSTAITAFNFSAIGGRAGFIGKAGEDVFGDFMIAELSKGGVDPGGIVRHKNLKTGATIVLANPPKKALLTYMGAMADLTIEDLNWDYIARARHLHIGGFFLQSGIRKDAWKIFEWAKEIGLTTSLDTNWDPENQWGDDLMQALTFTDIFFPNDDEALRIARTANLEDAIKFLSEKVNILAIKRGKEGAILKANGEVYRQKGIIVEAVETTGAGDSFNAGFLYQYLQHADWQQCLRWGNACGALAVTALGGSGAFQDRHRVQSQLESLLRNG
jgi:sugar/nucleoside kinase (ribokinase family)